MRAERWVTALGAATAQSVCLGSRDLRPAKTVRWGILGRYAETNAARRYRSAGWPLSDETRAFIAARAAPS
jgi:hypothetical protein